ncbi:MAG: thiamine diphosphokinase, partial [Treponema sp.]|nr:thiamine diphosphokinase [Treponema sp.]
AENAGIKPAWIIGDMDSLDDTLRLTAYPPERIIRLQHEKDYTDTEVALSLAIEKKCDQIWIIGGGGGRIDHLFGIRSLFERDIFPVRWITDTSDIYCINCNSALSELSLSRKKGTVVSVFPLGEGQWEAESIGLKWPLAGLPWNRGFFGLSNTTINESFFIKANKGRFMVILPGLV